MIDDELVERVKRLYGLRTTREAIEVALRALVSRKERRDLLDLEGLGWAGDLDEMRASRP